VPYAAWLAGALTVGAISRRVFGEKAKLPGLFVPCRFRARFRPLRFDTRKLQDLLGWSPPLDLDRCLRRTYEASDAGPAPLPHAVAAPVGIAEDTSIVH
jgi:hypothetical protein